jgi:hypothetical protein
LALVEIQQSGQDIRAKKIEITDRLAQQYRDTIGHVPARISSEVQKELNKYSQERQDLLAYNLEKNRERFMYPDQKKYIYSENVKGNPPLTPEVAQIFQEKYGDKAEAMAKKRGYRIMPDEFYLGLQR